MQTKSYIVQPGDTLSKIAEKNRLNPNQWRLLAEINNLPNPNSLRVGQTLQIPSDFALSSNVINTPTGSISANNKKIQIFIEDKTIYASIEAEDDWFRIGKRHKKGLFRVGNQQPENFIAHNPNALAALNLSPSDINIMLACSENEGNLDAVNTWDNQFISFGMFQWTAGGKNTPGELTALLLKVKQQNPDTFQHYWGQFGLDVIAHTHKTGWITLDGQILKSSQEKSALRQHIWAYRFAKAGSDEQVKAMEIAHAISRISQFYFNKSRKLDGYTLSELITSEFGVALLLDNHVNRPGYVFSCVALAIQQCGMSAYDLAQAGENEEKQVIAHYLDIRKSYGRNPMTHAEHRGNTTKKYLENGIISDKRGSFQSNTN